MTSQCIHGFPTEHCMSCRTCPHGQMTSACIRCRSELAARRPTRTVAQPAVRPESEEHGGYEVFYEPAVSGWRYRTPDSAPSRLSYRSAFLARKAVDQLGPDGEAPAAPSAKRKAKRKK